MLQAREQIETFRAFGTTVSVRAGGDSASVERGIALARRIARECHQQLTRFDPQSQLCLLNADPRERVPAGPLVRRLAAAIRWAGEVSDGLVDATFLPVPDAPAPDDPWSPEPAADGWLPAASPRRPFRDGWRQVGVDEEAVTRPRGLKLDSNGLAKGLAVDLMARVLAPCDTWAIDCGGDLRLGGRESFIRAIEVSPLHEGDAPARVLRLSTGAVATSATARHRGVGGQPSHHLLDPRTGRPADTGVVQATAIAPTCLEAEVRARAALLAGPLGAAEHLPDGGVIVTADGGVRELAPVPQDVLTLA